MGGFAKSFTKGFKAGLVTGTKKFKNKSADLAKKPDKPNQVTKLIDAFKPPELSTPQGANLLNKKRTKLRGL